MDTGATKKVAITGTAPTLRQTPWHDASIEVWTLNDQYLLNIPRSDRHYDLHPLDKFFYRDPRQRKVRAEDVPAGSFVRPTGHLEWLAKQSIPVYVQKADPRVPRARVFPYAEVHAMFDPLHPDGRVVCTSTPQWMLMQAMLEGYREIHIYGIHLATQAEYVKQREMMAWILGVAAGLGVKIVIPKAAPLLKSTHEYAYQPDPADPLTAIQRRTQGWLRQREDVAAALKAAPWYASKSALRARLAWLDAQVADHQAQAGHLALAQRIAVG